MFLHINHDIDMTVALESSRITKRNKPKLYIEYIKIRLNVNMLKINWIKK